MFALFEIKWISSAFNFGAKILQSWHCWTCIFQMAQLCSQDAAQQAVCSICVEIIQKRGQEHDNFSFFGLVQLLQK
jgi:hypothetical protein